MSILTALLLSAAAAPAPRADVVWHTGTFETALAEAGERDTLAAVYFWWSGSERCAAFYQGALSDPRVGDALAPYAVFSAQHGTEAGDALFERYRVETLPTVLFLRPDGEPEDLVSGYAEADVLLAELERIEKRELTISDLERKIAAAPADGEEAFEWRWRLSVKRGDLGDEEGATALLAAMREDDPRGKTLYGSRAVKTLAIDEAVREAGGTDAESLSKVNVRPLISLARKLKHPTGRFELWTEIAGIESVRGDVPAACKAYFAAAEDVPEEEAIGWRSQVAHWIMNAEGERTERERAFVVELSRAAAEAASRVEPCGCEEACECTPPARIHARYLGLLAHAYRFAGDAELATATAEQSLELDPSDEARERVAELL